MGPTNAALVKLFLADQKLREAQARLDAASRDVRIQERRVKDLSEKHAVSQHELKTAQASASNLELDLKTRDGHIEKLREQQQAARNNKEYQAFLVEINTQKVDRTKVEDQTMALMEQVEKNTALLQTLGTQLAEEQKKLDEMRLKIHDKVTTLQAEIETLRPARDEAATAVPVSALTAFERMADRYDGEAMAPISKPDRRVEEYLCSVCNMSLVADVYNRLRTRDQVLPCPSCFRLLYIPEDLTPEEAINTKSFSKVAKPKAEKVPKAPKEPKEPKAPRAPKAMKADKRAELRDETWSEADFFEGVRLNAPELLDAHNRLLDKLRAMDGVSVIFDGRTARLGSYNVYVNNVTQPILRVYEDGYPTAEWGAIKTAGKADASLYYREQIGPYTQSPESESGAPFKTDRKLFDTVDHIVAIMEGVAERVSGKGSSVAS